MSRARDEDGSVATTILATSIQPADLELNTVREYRYLEISSDGLLCALLGLRKIRRTTLVVASNSLLNFVGRHFL